MPIYPDLAVAVLAMAVLAVSPVTAIAHAAPSRKRHNDYTFKTDMTAVNAPSPATVVAIRHTPVMAATLTALLDHADHNTDDWMLITDVENALSDRHPGSGVRAALDRLSGVTVVVDDRAVDVLKIADHPTETWTNRRTGKLYRRQVVKLSPEGYRWATDYVRNMHKGKRDRAALRGRTVAARRSALRTTPLIP